LQWFRDRKRDYANDLTNPDQLVAAFASLNRQKGAQTPEMWKPPAEPPGEGMRVLVSSIFRNDSAPSSCEASLSVKTGEPTRLSRTKARIPR
jgi:hypothetical protein